MSRHRLQATMESLANKRQKEIDELAKWSTQTQYYKNWDRHNNKYQNWTSTESLKCSLNQYDALKCSEKKKESLEERRDRLRKIFFEEEQLYDLEIQSSPRHRQRRHYKLSETPTEVLKDVNVGLKIAEDDRRRHDAELKLYQQWKNENPILRNYETNQNRSDLKLAWLDQQIEKRMEKEKNEEEMRKLIQERDARILEEEKLERVEREENSKTEKELMNDISLQIQHFKLKESEAEILKREEEDVIKKKAEVEDMIRKNYENLQLREHKNIAVYNIRQSKLKLRKKALEVEEELKKQQELIEDIVASKAAEEIQNEDKKAQTKHSITSFLKYVRDQKQLEDQRQKYISFIFDSEAKNIWEKQEKQWREEQEARDHLLEDVLQGLHQQIDAKLTENIQKQQLLLQEREKMLQDIEDHDRNMKKTMEEMKQKKIERKLELDKQTTDKRLRDYKKKVEEDKKKKEDLENIRKEEAKLKHELTKMQRRHYPQNKYNKRIIW